MTRILATSRLAAVPPSIERMSCRFSSYDHRCKSELLPLWTIREPQAAKKSADEIYERFLDYRAEGDFVGMDVARKYLQMGYTRSRRYAKYKGGNKSKPLEKPDPKKSRVAEIFYKKWRRVAEDEEYLKLKEEHRRRNR